MRRLFIAICMYFFTHATWADPLFQPAMIKNDLALLAQVPFPESDHDFELFIRCSGYVHPARDHFYRHTCVPDSRRYTSLARAIRVFLEKGPFFRKRLLMARR